MTVAGGRLKRGAQVAVHRMDGRMYVLMEKKDWVSQASRGTSRSRSRLGRTGTIDKLRAHAVERMLTAARPASALADDPMRQLEEHLGSFAEGQQTQPVAVNRHVAGVRSSAGSFRGTTRT